MGIILFLVLLMVILWIGFKLTGVLLTACIWLLIKVPLGIFLGTLGLGLCLTILLIPLGWKCIKGGLRLILPG